MTGLKSTLLEHAASLLLVGVLVTPFHPERPFPGLSCSRVRHAGRHPDVGLARCDVAGTVGLLSRCLPGADGRNGGGGGFAAPDGRGAPSGGIRRQGIQGGGRAPGTECSDGLRTPPDVCPILPTFFSVLCASYLLARVVALYRFVSGRNGRGSSLRRYAELIRTGGVLAAFSRIDLPLRALISGVLVLLLFSPAYVVAYASRTRLETDNTLFAFLLAMFSNGLLVNYANRFHALLVTESRKGYVETARVKGLAHSYGFDRKDGLSMLSLLRPSALARRHVLGHIYLNARFQFMTTLKEHAAYLVTGLVVIELALNIKGDLCYALLQHMLYREYDIVAFILFLIFFTVKAMQS